MKDLSLTKKQMKSDLLEKGVKAVIKSLKEILPEDSSKYNFLVNLEIEQKELFINSLKRVLSEEQMQRANADIRDRLLSFIDSLENEDFEKDAPRSNFSQEKKYKKGHVLYQIPNKMQVLKETRCRVRIAFDEMMLIEDLEEEDDIQIKSNIRVSDYMRVEIIDPSADGAFEVRTTSDPVQFIDQDDFTEWRFYVKPLLAGEHTLELKVAIIILINGKEVKREKTLEESVVIIADEVPEEHLAFTKAEDNFILTEAASSYAKTTPSLTKKRNIPKGVVMGLVLLMLSSSLSYAFVPSINESVNWFITHQIQGSKEAYEGYIEKYQSKAESSKNIKNHIQQALEKIQEYDLEEALEDTTTTEGLDYLSKYENGKHVQEVKNHLANLAWAAIQAMTDTKLQKEKLIEFLDKYPDSKWTADAKSLLKKLNETPSPTEPNNEITTLNSLSSAATVEEQTEELVPTSYDEISTEDADMIAKRLAEEKAQRLRDSLNRVKEQFKLDSIKTAIAAEKEKLRLDSLSKISAKEKAQRLKDSIAMAKLNETTISKDEGLKKSYFVDDRDGQHYSIVLVDDLWWMARNLSYEAPESICYETNGQNCNRFGRLYSWRSAKQACPKGWRLPTDKEWADLTRSLYGKYTDCNDCFRGMVKGGKSGLNMLLGGRRYTNGRYSNINEFGYYWTATETTRKEARVYMFSSRSKVMLRDFDYKTNGLSCRCVKDK